jgi:hypothetical protein
MSSKKTSQRGKHIHPSLLINKKFSPPVSALNDQAKVLARGTGFDGYQRKMESQVRRQRLF